MAAIKGSHTKPELLIRESLHAAGLRYRLHVKDLPGKPDVVFPRNRAVVFVNVCFWHRHDCHLFKWPATRQDFWRARIGRNGANDETAIGILTEAGWRVDTVWEGAPNGRTRRVFAERRKPLGGW